MRYFFLLAAALMFIGCSDKNIEFKGTVAGANYGKVIIANADKEIIYQADINGGKFSIKKQPLQAEGLYNISFLAGGNTSRRNDIYLEPGSSYTIETSVKEINDYPHITGTSKKQGQLSTYNDLLKAAKTDARKKVMSFDAEMRKLDNAVLTFEDRSKRIQQLRNQQLDANVVNMVDIFNALVKKYPEGELIPYLMLNTDYQRDPNGYYGAFKKLNDKPKNTEAGKLLEENLKQLTGLTTGAAAPPIEGTTADGKAIDLKALNKNVIIIDFWRALNSQSEGDHAKIITDLLPKYKDKSLEIVSISLDDDREKWLSYIKKSNMTWPQVSDLKGDNSANAANWGITKVPTYYILDGSGHIIKRCLDFYELQTALADYMAKH
ncbi:TlpA family protein disulfide reductase [Mucilaginibacter auburnensis]|uniref:Peroxiredoxin n=1 Tax=Mucilaginibacter auburnensis TaxID=1457233 RepID=A0A2H9VRX4_9SPHI|nr:TlpA disulfide reductase family protein [Mucilaginibacter auburnensis]PJJ83549.1 peroxiredoxin [Mucilaginibacter auburnensis]